MEAVSLRGGVSGLAAIALGAIAVATGCGGGSNGSGEQGLTVSDDTTMTTAAKLTRAELLARVNRTCRRRWPTILENFAQLRKNPPSEFHGIRYQGAVRLSFVPGLVFYVFDTIYNLGAPPGEEQQLEEMIGAMLESAVRTRRGLSPIRFPGELEAHFAAYNRLARTYGLGDCLVAGAHLPPS